MRTAHTFAELEVSEAAYLEIYTLLAEAGYLHAFIDGAIDMHGIALTRKRKERQVAQVNKNIQRCPNEGDFRFTWLHWCDTYICGSCVEKLKAAADVLGMPARIRPVPEAEKAQLLEGQRWGCEWTVEVKGD